MKQIFLLTLLFSLLSTASIHAQHCSSAKSVEAKKACPHPTKSVMVAIQEDASVEKRFDEASGKTTYVRKVVCSNSGKVSYTPVEYCSKSGRFVNVSPRGKQCIKSKSVNSTERGVRAASVSHTEKVNCTTAQKAACAKACGKVKASSSPASETKAKLVKNQ